MKTRNFLLALLFLGSLLSFLYVNYDARMNKDADTVELSATTLQLNEESVSTPAVMPDVKLLHKAGSLIKKFLPISK